MPQSPQIDAKLLARSPAGIILVPSSTLASHGGPRNDFNPSALLITWYASLAGLQAAHTTRRDHVARSSLCRTSAPGAVVVHVLRSPSGRASAFAGSRVEVALRAARRRSPNYSLKRTAASRHGVD